MNSVTWSSKHPSLHDASCVCDECESYRRNEASWIQRREDSGEFDGNTATVEVLDNRDCIECGDYSKFTCDSCHEPLCYDCNEDMNARYGLQGDGKCFDCREE